MEKVKAGDTVKVHYTGKLDDGTVFDTSEKREPLQFTVGSGQVIEGFDQGVIGMRLGECKTVAIPMEKAYGPHHKEWVMALNREDLPPDMQPEVGQQFQMRQPNGKAIAVTVTDVSESAVTLDVNHPLAGENLTFDICLVEVG